MIQLGIALFLLTLGFFVGGYIERRHFRKLDEQEASQQGFLITQIKSYPGGATTDLTPQIFAAEAVISSDYLKTFLSGIRKFFGGELRSYRSLLERARRQALARVVAQATAQGYDAICNLRFDTAAIGGSKKSIVMVAIIASATAYKRADN